MTDAAPSTPQHDTQEPPRARAAPSEECTFCHRTIAPVETYHRVTVGMNEDGGASSSHPTVSVEEVSELVACSECQLTVGLVMDGFLERLWSMVAPTEPHGPESLGAMGSDDLPPSEPTEPASRLPSPKLPPNLLSTDACKHAQDMLTHAAKAFPPSPPGFMLGVAIGRFLAAGLSREDIHALVDNAIGTVAPMVPEGLQS